MPWRNKYIATRRHPLAIATYLMTLLMGVFFLAGLFDSRSLNVIGVGWQIAWQWLLVLGGSFALLGVAWPQRHLQDALTLEAAGAAACGAGLIVYSIAIIIVFGWSAPVWILLGALAVGALLRASQARSDRRRVEALARTIARAAR